MPAWEYDIAAIRDQELDETYQSTRRQNKDIYKRIEEAAIGYWRISGLLRKVGSATLLGRTQTFPGAFAGRTSLSVTLTCNSGSKISRWRNISGCYCFKTGKKYTYVGACDSLAGSIENSMKNQKYCSAR